MKQGFTLVELSIVLIIIGLLVGGILVGQSLITNVQIKRTVAQATQFKILIADFRSRFRFLPGDLPGAQTMLGATYNGDGNGVLEWGSGSTGCPRSDCEIFSIWEHLSLAGLLKETYVAQYTGGRGRMEPGVNSPEAFYNNGSPTGWMAFGRLSGWNANWGGGGRSGQTLIKVGSFRGDGHSWNGPFTPIEALAIDRKIDDGLPGQGNVWTHGQNGGVTGPCTTSNGVTANSTSATARYWIESDTDECALLFWLRDGIYN